MLLRHMLLRSAIYMPPKTAGRRPRGNIANLHDFKAAQDRPFSLKMQPRV